MTNDNEFNDTFRLFMEAFVPDENTITGNVWRETTLLNSVYYEEFAQQYAGASFNKGIFRFYDASSGPVMQHIMEETYYGGQATETRVFGSDWMGRQYGLSPLETEDGKQQVLMFEIEDGRSYVIPVDFIDFFEEGLLFYRETLLLIDLHEKWVGKNKDKDLTKPYLCAGLIVPVALGGEREVKNLRATDMDVYWSLTWQILGQLTEGS